MGSPSLARSVPAGFGAGDFQRTAGCAPKFQLGAAPAGTRKDFTKSPKSAADELVWAALTMGALAQMNIATH